MTGTLWGACHEQFFAACRRPPYAPEGGDAGVRLRDAGRRLWPCPQRPGAGAHLYKYDGGTGNWDDYTRLLNRTIAARVTDGSGTANATVVKRKPRVVYAGKEFGRGGSWALKPPGRGDFPF